MSASNNWQKSSFSGGGGENCIEVDRNDGTIVMRESDDPAVILSTSPAKFEAFLLGVKAGEFDHFIG
ncbi:DUF397 domain-containing protein [Streptomyces sp. NPDC058740]|uniref:DUF397 domain-containing protein n=1 Tax=Streptomyces sp. NPDC058740 TaxID=3346619 RepID=UPI00369C3603